MANKKKMSVRGGLLKIYPFLFGELERLVSESEDWLGVLTMPLDTSIDSREVEELLKQFGDSFVEEGRAELIQLLNPVHTYKRNTISATEVRPKKVKWVVKDVIKESAIHLLAGDPSAGKSFLTMEIASKVSTGGELFGHSVDEGRVLIYSAEDNAEDTIVPRLLTQGAKLENIRLFDEAEPINFPSDLNKIYYEVALERPKVLIFDTINTFLDDSIDTNSDKAVRKALAPFKKLAEFYNLVIIFVTHMNKGGNSNPLYRISGSIAYVGLSRIVWFFAQDQDTPEVKIFSVGKTNIGKTPSYEFELDVSSLSSLDQPNLKFKGESDLLAQEVGYDHKTEPQSKVEECAIVIFEYLEKEGRKEASTLQDYITNTNDFSVSCYKRARKLLTDKKLIQSIKEGQRWYVETLETVETLDESEES